MGSKEIFEKVDNGASTAWDLGVLSSRVTLCGLTYWLARVKFEEHGKKVSLMRLTRVKYEEHGIT